MNENGCDSIYISGLPVITNSQDEDKENNIIFSNNLLQNDYITNSLKIDKNNEAVIELLDHITKDKEKTNDKLFIISAAYDKIYKKYYGISLSILILSSIATLIEAFRLSIIDFVNKSSLDANIYVINFTMNVISLIFGTVITVLSSIIRFKNYREILEQLRDKQNLLINYRDKFNKKYESVLNMLAFDNLTSHDVKSIYAKISQYDSDIKAINILQYIRNDEIIVFNKYKADYEFALRKIDIDKEFAIERYEQKVIAKKEGKNISTNNRANITNEIEQVEQKSVQENDDEYIKNLQKYINIQKIKKILLQRNTNISDIHRESSSNIMQDVV
jgi:hypothetical protein